MARGTRAKLQVEGEKDFNESLRTMVAQLRAVNSELVLTAAKFEGQEKSVEALTASQTAYQKQSETLEREIALLEKGVKAAGEQFGENSREVADLQNKLNKAQTEFVKTDRALDELGASLEKAKKSADGFNEEVDDIDNGAKGLGDILDSLGGKFGVSLPSNMKNTLDEMIQIDGKTLALVGTMAALATAIAKAEQKLIDITRESAAYADEILTMSTTTGIATEALQEYTYAADLLDVSVETITGSQARLIRSMGAAQEGTAAQADAFAKLGVTYQNTDGSLRNAEEVFWDTIDALGQMQNETERDAIAMDLLGRSAQDLNPLIKAGSDRMAELADEAHEMGYVLDDEALGVLGEVDDAMQRLNRQTEATKNKVAVEFAPSLIDVTEKLTALIDGLGEALVDSGAVDAFGSILESEMDLIMPTSALSEDGVPRLTEALKPLAQMLALVADTMSAIAGLAHILTGSMHLDFSQVGEGWEMMTTAMGFNVSSGQLSAQQKLNYQNALKTQSYNATVGGYAGSSYAQYEEDMKNGFSGSYEYWLQQRSRNSTGNDNWRGGLTWVGENGPELAYFPRGTEILNATESREVVGGDTFYITIDAKNVREFNEIVRIAQTARMNARKGVSG